MFSKIAIILVALAVVDASGVLPIGPIVVENYAPKPYSFGYNVRDVLSDQFREEVSNGVAVTGSYGFADARGIRRRVNYIADAAGFRADVLTNEPGTANQNPAAVRVISDAPVPLAPVAVPIVAEPVVAAKPVVDVVAPVIA